MNSESSAVVPNPRFSQTPVSSDMPVFYSIRKKFKLRSALPSEVSGQAIRSWCDQSNGLHPFANWTNDWTQFRAIWGWITPLSRWGNADVDFMDGTVSTYVRNRLQALSDIIPVVYDTDDHYRIIFRIGEQMFYCRSFDSDRDERLSNDFEDGIVIGVLPIS